MLPRRFTALLAVATLASAVTVLVGDQPSMAQQVGQTLREPPEYSSRDGVLQVKIVVERRQVDLAGHRLWALTYNGFYMPPTLRFRPGDRMDLTMVNRLGSVTNLHVHGLHVSPAGDSDNIFVHIQPGKTFQYVYRFPDNLAPGTYWYHSHAHPDSAGQVGGGLSGIIIVDGLARYLPGDLNGITEHVVALKDFQVDGDSIRTQNLHASSPTNRTVNGQLNPTIPIRPGETQLWRLANISANIYYRLHLGGERFHVIAQDANPVRDLWSTDTIVMPPGARYDVLVQGGPPGRTQLETLAYDTGPVGNQFPQQNLATLVSSGTPMPPAVLPTTFAPMEDLTDAPVAYYRLPGPAGHKSRYEDPAIEKLAAIAQEAKHKDATYVFTNVDMFADAKRFKKALKL